VKNLIILDYHDPPTLQRPCTGPEGTILPDLYFKRSAAMKGPKNQMHLTMPPHPKAELYRTSNYPVVQLNYHLRREFAQMVLGERTPLINREYDICTVVDHKGNGGMRMIAPDLIEKQFTNSSFKFHTGPVSKLGMSARQAATPNARYVEMLQQRCKIVVTANPAGWEGDFRLCESLAGGGLVFTDEMVFYNPWFLPQTHFVEYNTKTLVPQLGYYLANLEEAERIARMGREEVLARHKDTDFLSYLLTVIAKMGEWKESSFCEKRRGCPALNFTKLLLGEEGHLSYEGTLPLPKNKTHKRNERKKTQKQSNSNIPECH
jgi:hypothetical protein